MTSFLTECQGFSVIFCVAGAFMVQEMGLWVLGVSVPFLIWVIVSVSLLFSWVEDDKLFRCEC